MTTRRTLLQTGAVNSLSFLDLHSLFAAEGSPISWSEIDQLGLCANHGLCANEVPLWKGIAPEFVRVA